MSNESLMQFVWKYFSSHDDDMIIVRKSMIDICDGDFNAAMMISQILYWHNKYKDMNRWMKITNKEWHDQCRLTEWKIRSANKIIKKLGFANIKVKRFNRVPCLHYQINFEVLTKSLNKYIENDFRNGGNIRINETEETSESETEETTHSLTEHTKQSIQQRVRVKIAAPPEFATLTKYKTITFNRLYRNYCQNY